jgi:hypothetical protein
VSTNYVILNSTYIKIIPLPWREEVRGRGKFFAAFPDDTFHPDPNPPPSRGREFDF